LAFSPARYYTPSGAVELAAVTDAVAVEVGGAGALAKTAARAGAQVDTLFAGRYAIVRAPRSLSSALVASGGARRLLALYRTANGRELLADGLIRARFASGIGEDEIGRRVKLAGGSGVRVLRAALGLYEVTARAEETAAVAARLHEDHLALWAHPDFVFRARRTFVPSDELFADEWHLSVIGASGAWELGRGSPDVIIAIIDSGTDIKHPDLAAKIVSPRDELYQDDDPTPDPTDAHGTSTAGLAAAVTDNALGIAGVCPDCSIMPIRIMDEAGYSREGADADAFYWAADHGAQVLSNSWGPEGVAPVPYSLDNAITYVAEQSRAQKGAVVLFAAGNDSRENAAYELPSHPLVLGIVATNYFDQKFDYSNWGADMDLAAPAASVTTDISGADGYAAGDYTFDFGGTSAATPVTAGVAGLVFSVDPTMTRGQVVSAMFATADPVGDVPYVDGVNGTFGHGRVNAFRAMQAATGGAICQPVPEDCYNGVDDDCDWLVDGADPSCAPTETVVGAECQRDFQCGVAGACFPEAYGYPGGYCTAGCTESCPGDGVCEPFHRGGICVDGCASAADCRAGYDCLHTADNGPFACTPSCKLLGCAPGETCEEGTGACMHDGPSPAGGACLTSVECADNGRCLSESETGVPGGFCSVRCDSDADCGNGLLCESAGWYSMCASVCERVSDCREGYSCWPSDAHAGFGICWPACTADADCDGTSCNEWGLCGDATPPLTTPPDPPASVADVCACDVTTACDDNCPCDPECKKKGCAASPASGAALVMVLAVGLTRRRRVRA